MKPRDPADKAIKRLQSRADRLIQALAIEELSGNNGMHPPNHQKVAIMFKLQVQDDDKDPQAWHDVKDPDGKLLIFEKEAAARARLEELYPILVKMERYAADTKRTRVISMYAEKED